MMKLRSRSDVQWHIATAIYDGDVVGCEPGRHPVCGIVVMFDNHSEARIFDCRATTPERKLEWRFITRHSDPEEYDELCKQCPCSIDMGKGVVCGKPYGHTGGHAAAKVAK